MRIRHRPFPNLLEHRLLGLVRYPHLDILVEIVKIAESPAAPVVELLALIVIAGWPDHPWSDRLALVFREHDPVLV